MCLEKGKELHENPPQHYLDFDSAPVSMPSDGGRPQVTASRLATDSRRHLDYPCQQRLISPVGANVLGHFFMAGLNDNLSPLLGDRRGSTKNRST